MTFRSSMCALREQAHRVRRHAGWKVRDRFPDRKVVRTVQGVEMTLPWAHRLPDYAVDHPLYGQNLVELARALSLPGEPLTMLDIGANVGDSALQVLDVTDGRIVCVEADAYYVDYLRTNVGSRADCRIEPSVLVPASDGHGGEAADGSVRVSSVRKGGTARLVPDAGSSAVPAVTPAQLRDRHPWLADLRLVKSDTDGYDVSLIPAVAAEFTERKPVLFFEYDLSLSRRAGHDPRAVWPTLAALGYTDVAIWGHFGDARGRTTVLAMDAATDLLAEEGPAWQRPYWDVAVVHGEDRAGLAAIRLLVVDELASSRR